MIIKTMYKEIANTNGRYLISEDGRVLDTTPFYMEHMEWQWESIDPTQPREVTVTEDNFFYIKDNGRITFRNINSVLKETFPELYTLSDNIKQRIISSYENKETKTYSISLRDFNKLIFPNELIQIYDTTCNKQKPYKKPTIIKPNEKGIVTLRKNRKYFGIGTRNIIHFDNQGLPKNAKSWAEPTSTFYDQKNKENII